VLYSLILERRSAKNRNNRHVDCGLTDSFNNLLLGNGIGVFKETLKELIVVRCNCLNKLGTPLVNLVLHVGRNGLQTVVGSLQLFVLKENNGLILNKIDNAVKVIFGPDRELNGNWSCTQFVFNFLNHPKEIGTHTVHLVNIGNAGNPVLIGLTPNGFALGFNTTHSTESGNSAIEYAERSLHLNGEVHVSRGVDNVYLILLVLVVPKSCSSGRGNSYTTLLLLHHPVHRCSPIMYLTNPVSFTCIKQDTLGSCCFTGVDVGHNPNIPSES